MTLGERLFLRVIATLVLWGVIWAVWYAVSPPGGLWWVCLLIAAVVVFIGEVLIRTSDGGWDLW